MYEVLLFSYWWLLTVLFKVVSCDVPCEYGWTYSIRTHFCYSHPSVPLPWQEALSHCQNLAENGHLVSIHSEQEKDFVEGLIDDEFLSWTGLRIVEEELVKTELKWSDESTLNYTYFERGQPGSRTGCVAWSADGDRKGWRVIDCDYNQFFICKIPAVGNSSHVFTKPSGEFSSPNYPNEYDHDINLHFIIEAPSDHRIIIEFSDFDTEQGRDVLMVMDGMGDAAPTLARLSGQFLSDRSVISRGNVIYMNFKSDESDGGRGFKAKYRFWKEPSTKRLNELIAGELTSENYPETVPRYSNQEYIIQCADEHHLHFNITELELAPRDKLSFFDGSSRQSGELQIISGNPSVPIYFRSTNSEALVVFQAKDNEQNSKRWKFLYNCVRNDGMGEEVIID